MISKMSSILKSSVYGRKIPAKGFVYKERKEAGYKNLSEKMKRVKEGGPFEWPNIVALNKAVASFIGNSKKIINIGSGTGTFEWIISNDETLDLTASEFDESCLKWCKKNRQRGNILYVSTKMEDLLKKKKFDMAVSVDVIEHVEDYGNFLKEFSQLADKAVITTPNRDRSFNSAILPTPDYYQHVREWNAGEFYWVLKMFYRKVDLYAMPDVNEPNVVKIGILSSMTPLIAVCDNRIDD